MRQESKSYTTKKKKSHKKESNNVGNEKQTNKKRYKTYRKQTTKWQKSFLITNYFKWKWFKFLNQKAELQNG